MTLSKVKWPPSLSYKNSQKAEHSFAGFRKSSRPFTGPYPFWLLSWGFFHCFFWVAWTAAVLEEVYKYIPNVFFFQLQEFGCFPFPLDHGFFFWQFVGAPPQKSLDKPDTKRHEVADMHPNFQSWWMFVFEEMSSVYGHAIAFVLLWPHNIMGECRREIKDALFFGPKCSERANCWMVSKHWILTCETTTGRSRNFVILFFGKVLARTKVMPKFT